MLKEKQFPNRWPQGQGLVITRYPTQTAIYSHIPGRGGQRGRLANG